MVYEAILELILAFNWPSEASWKADVIKYDFREGPKSFGGLFHIAFYRLANFQEQF